MKHTAFCMALAGCLLQPLAAQAAWRIHVKMAAPSIGPFDPGYRSAPRWQKRKYWAFYAPMKCWKVDHGRYHSVHKNGQLYSVEFSNNGEDTINSDTQCAGDDKWLTLMTFIRSAEFYPPRAMWLGEDTSFTSTHKFRVDAGGLFSDNRYYVDDKLVEKKYFDSVTLCTDIVIHGPDKPDDVTTRKC